MMCPTCETDMVKAKATAFGEEYDYCRSCKKELKEMMPASSIPSEVAMPDYIPDFIMESFYLDSNGNWHRHDSNNPPPSTL